MRLAIDGSHWAIPGGVRSYLENLIPALVAVEPRLEVQMLLRGRTAEFRPDLPDRVRAVPMRGSRRMLDFLENHFGWPKVERTTGPVDVVHGTHFSLPRARSGVPTVLTVHDVAYLRRPDLYDDPRGNDYGYRTLLRHSLRRADRVIALAHRSKEDLVSACDVDPERVWVVPHGVDPRFSPAAASVQQKVRRKLGIEGAFAIYPVGTITPRKNIPACLRAFSAAFPDPKSRPTLLLTGPKSLPAEARAVVTALGLDLAVRSASVRYPDELAALLTAARWGIYPSLYEGFGLPPLEAMACGLPMLVSDRTSCPEVVGDAAALVDPEDPEALAAGMRRLEEDEAWREELRIRGHRRVADPAYSWQRAARQTIAVYRDDPVAFAAETDPLVPVEVLVDTPHSEMAR